MTYTARMHRGYYGRSYVYLDIPISRQSEHAPQAKHQNARRFWYSLLHQNAAAALGAKPPVVTSCKMMIILDQRQPHIHKKVVK